MVMTKPRAYRDGMQCRRCGSNWLPKMGLSRGKQTYRCGQCGYHFVPESKKHFQPERVRKLAVGMYNEGSGAKDISRLLGVHVRTVYVWVEKSRMDPKVVMDTDQPGESTPIYL